jgi:hypothetical protein
MSRAQARPPRIRLLNRPFAIRRLML